MRCRHFVSKGNMAALSLLPTALLVVWTQFIAVQTQIEEYNPDTHLSTVSATCHIEVASHFASIVTACLGDDLHDAKQISVMTHGASSLATKCICFYHLCLRHLWT
jgi:hypothetical protein